MAHTGLHRRTPTTTRPRRRWWRTLRRSRAARHLPFTAYCLITATLMGWIVVLMSRATG
ncbi:MAG: hypothetical protein HOV73_01790 [Streptomyces sp.]|nr:hypothetical protein [Streptomyces sp.]